ncbi:MAG: hypothetical protein K6T83_23525, partial [Alicyclobacillus sp.]|nr:hypothetical protein [Alicyclobacillus sp.]
MSGNRFQIIYDGLQPVQNIPGRAAAAAEALRPLWWILALNILMRGAWLAFVHPPQQYDFLWYYTHAVSLLRGQGYTMYGHYTAYWPIGYPFFLSLLFRVTGPTVMAGLAANVVISLIIVSLVYALALHIFHRTDAAVAAALFYT